MRDCQNISKPEQIPKIVHVGRGLRMICAPSQMFPGTPDRQTSRFAKDSLCINGWHFPKKPGLPVSTQNMCTQYRKRMNRILLTAFMPALPVPRTAPAGSPEDYVYAGTFVPRLIPFDKDVQSRYNQSVLIYHPYRENQHADLIFSDLLRSAARRIPSCLPRRADGA